VPDKVSEDVQAGEMDLAGSLLGRNIRFSLRIAANRQRIIAINQKKSYN
jgi:hypothetical protein